MSFGFTVSRLQANGDVADDVYTPPVVVSPGTVKAGDAKVSDHFSDSYTLGNGWREGMKFEVNTTMTVWATNNDRGGAEKQCIDSGSAPYTIPDN